MKKQIARISSSFLTFCSVQLQNHKTVYQNPFFHHYQISQLMKTYQIKFLLFVLFIFGGLCTNVNAQSPPCVYPNCGILKTTINVTGNNNQLTYDVSDNTKLVTTTINNSRVTSTEKDIVFILFGDGNYHRVSGDATGVKHNYPTNGNQSYELMAFKAKKGDPIDPFNNRAYTPNITTPSPRPNRTNSINNRLRMNGASIKLDRSWDLSPGKHAFIIIALDKVEVGDEVYFDFDDDDLSIQNLAGNPNSTIEDAFHKYNPHQANANLNLISGINNSFNKQLIISNLGSSANKQTHLFIKVKCKGKVDEKGKYQVRQKKDDYSDVVEFTKKGYPHDPNYIEVDTTTLWNPTNPWVPFLIQDQLTYKVHFQNEGNAFAKDVELKVDLFESHLDLASISSISSSSSISPSINLDPNPPTSIAIFKIDGINLPGTNQIDPATNTFYTYKESCGFIKFTIQTTGMHQVGDLIPAWADIIFVAEYEDENGNTVQKNMPPIRTNIVNTLVTGDCGGGNHSTGGPNPEP